MWVFIIKREFKLFRAVNITIGEEALGQWILFYLNLVCYKIRITEQVLPLDARILHNFRVVEWLILKLIVCSILWTLFANFDIFVTINGNDCKFL